MFEEADGEALLGGDVGISGIGGVLEGGVRGLMPCEPAGVSVGCGLESCPGGCDTGGIGVGSRFSKGGTVSCSTTGAAGLAGSGLEVGAVEPGTCKVGPGGGGGSGACPRAIASPQADKSREVATPIAIPLLLDNAASLRMSFSFLNSPITLSMFAFSANGEAEPRSRRIESKRRELAKPSFATKLSRTPPFSISSQTFLQARQRR